MALVGVHVHDVLGVEPPVVGVHRTVTEEGVPLLEQLAGVGLFWAVELGDGSLDLQALRLGPFHGHLGHRDLRDRVLLEVPVGLRPWRSREVDLLSLAHVEHRRHVRVPARAAGTQKQKFVLAQVLHRSSFIGHGLGSSKTLGGSVHLPSRGPPPFGPGPDETLSAAAESADWETSRKRSESMSSLASRSASSEVPAVITTIRTIPSWSTETVTRSRCLVAFGP